MRKVGVLLIHGMGSQEEGFADPMIKRLRRELERDGVDPARVEFQPIWWAPVLLERQAKLLAAMQAGNDLDWIKLRRFVIEALGDAVAYQKTFQNPSEGDELPVYDAVHTAIGESIHALARRLQDSRAPLLLVAHSLGCHMMSNYIWDVQKHGPAYPFVKDKESPFELLKTLTAIDTFGCNMPLFLLASDKLSPIRFPLDLKDVFPGKDPSAVARWRNYFDPDDVLGWPLQPVRGYEKLVRDKAVNAGTILTMWNPASHTAYWTDADVVEPIEKNLVDIVRLL